jgi:hypothetical protein
MRSLSAGLDRMREAIMRGDFAALQSMTPEIEALVTAVDGLAAHEVQGIAEKARRNMAMLAAALQGGRAAHRRLHDLREAASGHRTYGPGGQRSSVGGQLSTLRQRV